MVNKQAIYKQRIDKALDFIEARLDTPIRLEEVARASHFSPFHFHRIFHALLGETLNDYIGRRRLERAANMLLFKRDMRITDIAEACGFSSAANFSKLFKLHFGVSPSRLRNPGRREESKIGKLKRKYGKVFNPADLYPRLLTERAHSAPGHTREMSMKVKVAQIEQMSLCRLTSPGGYESAALFQTWDRLIEWAAAQGIDEKRQQRFAFCYDNPLITPVDKCRYEAAIVVEPALVPGAPFESATIPAGRYAIAHYRGAAEQSADFHMTLYGQWLPENGFEPGDHPLMEHYLNDVREDGFVDMEVFVKLKALA